jgi:pimeloyl-ACP methyl ester carboxylesterase
MNGKEIKLMGIFFKELDKNSIKLRIEEIIPPDIYSENVREDTLYSSYIRTITWREGIDDKLYESREKALSGKLSPGDYQQLNGELVEMREKAKKGELTDEKGEKLSKFKSYAKVKSFAMAIAQVLFVDNSIKEGLLERIEDSSKKIVLEKLSHCIKYRSENYKPEGGKSLDEKEIEFYAALFALQPAFDKIFVPDEEIVRYKEDGGIYRGEYEITNSYKRATSYLTLTNKKVIDASEEEKELCYNITTGWCDGIDLTTWNELNDYYYKELSPTTGEKNLFASNYEDILERMLPQFALSKVKFAEEILRQEYKNYKKEPLHIVEIGAGSGSFAIDLYMACLRLKIETSKIIYRGLEPNDHMRGKLEKNMKQKLGITALPPGWKLEGGYLESFNENPSNYLEYKNTIIVLCYCAHHCFHESILKFFNNKKIMKGAKTIYVLDVVEEHGWTKPYYTWADCESPENFDNVVENGIWKSRTLWQEPNLPIEGNALTNAWCSLRKLTCPDESYIRLSSEEIIFLRHNKLKKGKKTLLFVHGLGESGLCFQEVFSDSRFDDFNLLVPDMIGYGRSSCASNSRYCFDLQVQRLWQLVEHFYATFDINELVLIGHSLGGDLTTLFCREYLDKKIIKQYINIEGDITPHELFFSGQAENAFDRGGFAGFETWLREEFANKVYDEYARKFGDSLQRYYASLRFCRPEAFLQNAKELCLRNRKFPGEKIQSEIGKIYLSISEKIPAVFCYGTESLKPETIRFLEENNVNHEAFEGAGHWVMIDKKEEFYDFLYNFIK